MFFDKKYWLYLSKEEYDLIIHCLIKLKNNLIRHGRYTDAVDDILIKFLIFIKNANYFILFSVNVY